ncbi:protein phosphatase 2C domain-containing protein [uncultured Faecalibaculum sp.]|uniref:protein phosphatase 2C domain-containing protein n=1 Tax=uncultured Faecalibaculum sp. TaxID=1729681 RepID=UPI002637EDA1|nr:protein phosphatase 2C domain-containing protein [uncultured Faecalibaculum sp.]
MNICQTTKQGTAHQLFSVPNQDALAFEMQDGRIIAAVCDGVSLDSGGNWSRSQIAAAFCADAFVSALRSAPSETASLFHAFQNAAGGLLEHLQTQEIPWMDCQTTLLGVIVTESCLYAGMAGDGGIICEDAAGDIRIIVTKPKTDSMVEPIVMASAWRFHQVEHPRRVLIATDGVFDALIHVENGEFAADLNQVRQWLNASQDELDQLTDALPGHDDKTVVVIRTESSEKTAL